MTAWQMAAILAVYFLGSSTVAMIIDRRAQARDNDRHALDEHLTRALQQLLEQRERQQP